MPTKTKAKSEPKTAAVAAEPAKAPKGSAPIRLFDKDEAQRIHEEAQQVATSLPAWADPKVKFADDDESIDARMSRLHRSRQ